MRSALFFLFLILSMQIFAVTHIIEVRNFEYVPLSVSINLGDTVTFQWIEGNHPTVSDSGIFSDIPMDILNQQFDLVLTSAGTFSFHCLIHGSSGGSGMSGSITVSAEPFICEKTDASFVDLITSNSARVNWDIVDGATKYGVFYRSFGTSSWFKKPSVTNTKILTGLSASTLYQYKIKTICGTDQSNFTPVSTFTTASLKETSDTPIFNCCYSIEDDQSLTILIHGATPGNCITKLFDATGKVIVMNNTIINGKLHEESLILPPHSKGFYILAIENEENNLRRKILLF
ncbi:MAG: hypothetical protein H7Y00_10555 [Fimbriimonadaceae bacterium]|nr:hypothetical protein [Chitinophagales bacterium]